MSQAVRMLSMFAVVSCALPALAQDDKAGCQESPLFNRMPNHYIYHCETKQFVTRNYPAGPLKDGKVKTVTVEGPWTVVTFRPKEGTTKPTALQYQRNFEAAAKKAGASVEGSYGPWCKLQLDESWEVGNGCTDYASTMKFSGNGKEIWVLLNSTSRTYTGYEDGYSLMITERQAMSQDIVATDILEKINKDGFISLYLNFETGSAKLDPSSNSQLDQIAEMMKSNSALKLEVGGHTDNVGDANANLKLSNDRATTVKNALVSRGIPAARLTSKGYGHTMPIADNRLEDGRAKNRRVELVKH